MAELRKFAAKRLGDAVRGRAPRAVAERVRCTVCAASPFCLGSENDQLEQGVELRRLTIERGAPLFQANTPLRAFYVVRSGSIKTCVSKAQGGEQVVGFHLPGEIVGFDGIASGMHACTGISIAHSEVCCLSLPSLYKLADSKPQLHKEISRLMARELAGRRVQLLLFRGRADRRVAWFLLNLAERMTEKLVAPVMLKLPMSRRDMASMLGLKGETVSRMLGVLKRERLIEVLGQRIKLLDPARMRTFIGYP